jgi:hypothetical protein
MYSCILYHDLNKQIKRTLDYNRNRNYELPNILQLKVKYIPSGTEVVSSYEDCSEGNYRTIYGKMYDKIEG